jgi:hypothetical protein
LAAEDGRKEVVDLLLKARSSMFEVNNEVIKPSVKLRQTNIKLFK